MPDFAMCQNKECKSSSKCLRHLAIPSEFSQVYVAFTPEKGEDRCTYIIDTNNEYTRRNFRDVPR